jgi:1,2-diacylglycerol 3-alpha-glucosyltransferase
LRIGIFTNTFWPTVNGVAISVGNLREGLEQLGHEVYIFAPAPSDFDLSLDDPRIIRFPSVSAPGDADYQIAVPVSMSVNKTLRKLDFDVIHTHHPVWVGVWGQWYARWSGTPLVTTVHTQYEIYSKLIPLPDAVVDAYLKVRVTSYCNKCDVVTTPAKSSRQRLLAQGVTTPIEVVYNPTDLSAHAHADGGAVRRRFGFAENDVVLGYVGRLAPEKNLDMLLDAAEILMARDPRIHLLLVGDGPSREGLESRAQQLPCGSRIAFAGNVDHDEVPAYDAALDLFLTASMFEVQPLSFAEAMAAGAPVIAMDAPGGNDMIEDGLNGRLVPPEEEGCGLARCVLEVLEKPETLRQMSEQARQWASRYDKPTVVNRLLEVYDRAMQLAQRVE